MFVEGGYWTSQIEIILIFLKILISKNMYQAYLTKKGMRGMQFLACHFNFIPLLQREMYIASWYFLLWYCTGCCTGQACFLQCAFSCVLQMLYTLFRVQFSVTDWQFENFNYFARVFSGNFLTGRFLQLKKYCVGCSLAVPVQFCRRVSKIGDQFANFVPQIAISHIWLSVFHSSFSG